MKKIIASLLILYTVNAQSQEINVALKQAVNYERKLKEDSAILKYKEVIALDANHIGSLLKIAELTVAAGSRQKDIKARKPFYEDAKGYADKAFTIDSMSADVNYVKGLVALKLSEVEQENKKMVALIKDAKIYADKAVTINPNHAKANHLIGKWHADMINTASIKKTAAKLLYGGIPEAKMETAILHFEKSKLAEPYFVQNFLDLAKAYKFENNPSKAIEVLNQLVKLPTRTADDVALKAEGKQLLSQLQ